MLKKHVLAMCVCWLAGAGTAYATPILYDFNYDTGATGFITGTFTADFDAGANVPITSFEFTFAGVTFDQGPLRTRIAGGATDFTGVQSYDGGVAFLSSSSTLNAMLRLDTCGSIQCFASWTGIPQLNDGQASGNQPQAVSRASGAVPEPASIALLGLGLAGLGYSRRTRQTRS